MLLFHTIRMGLTNTRGIRIELVYGLNRVGNYIVSPRHPQSQSWNLANEGYL